MPSETETRFATQIGYTLRGVTPTCLLTVRGRAPLFIDVDARPITVRPGSGDPAGLELEMDAADAASFAPGKEMQIDGWVASGRIVARGTEETVARLRARWRGGFLSQQYAQMEDRMTDPRFVFMNHGFVELDGSDDFAWVKPGDEPWRYSLNLVRQTVRNVPLDGMRLLDVGCGRGGTCSYFARYHAPAEIVGVDIVPGQVDFCSATHRYPNVRFEPADAQDLPFEDASFDVATNIESSHCYPRLSAFFSEVRRVLRPGGLFCYTDNLDAGHVEARRRKLQSYGNVRWERTITAEVAEALRQCRGPLLELAREMAHKAGADAAFVEQFTSAYFQCREKYVSGAWDYAIWQMVRT
jgi:ubiquinone/menaquinone biosynthesis C-methylase UbiE